MIQRFLIFTHFILFFVNTFTQKIDGHSSTSQSVSIEQKPSIARQISPPLLADTEECKADIQRYCTKGSSAMTPNLKVLQCVDDLDNAVYLIDSKCQNLIWKFKYNMTHDPYFDDAAIRYCSKDIKLFEDCHARTDERRTGGLITCLYEKLININEPNCRYYINQLQIVVFNDWRLMGSFTDACFQDITEFQCGGLDDNTEMLLNETGAVISCLSKKYREVTGYCRKEIFYIAEMQSDDYHLDRALYYACRDDRERLCSQVASGNGRVYRCLYEQKFNIMMSSACRKEVHRRQVLVVENVKTDAPLIRACESEIHGHKCAADSDDNDKQTSLVKLLICLTKSSKKGYHIQDECRREMLIHRRMLMSDYALSPQIVAQCKTEMIQHCPSLYQQGTTSTIDSRGGRMIHCLLRAAQNETSFSKECFTNIKSLMRAADPGNDIRADPLLETTCRPVIDALCSKVKPGESNVIMCLLENIKSNRMTEDCEERLMEISYFMLRDWRLTPRLMPTCQTGLINFCKFPQDWSMDTDVNDTQVGMYLGCLYQNQQQLDSGCRTELKRLMRIQSQSIGLTPEIEDDCMTDLAPCKNPAIKGEEMKCLQKIYENLEDKCKDAVRKYTKVTVSDPTLDFPLMKSCESMIQIFCPNVGNGNENDLLRCLIKSKNNPKMDYRCKANIEHNQIISLKDVAFLSPSFQKKCNQEIAQHCPGKTTKASTIQCLARLMLKDVLKKHNQLTQECRDELKFELFQRSESIDLDPSLLVVCLNDIRILCSELNPGNAEIIDCLKENRNKVSTRCYNQLKKREKLDIILPETDYSLMSKCSSVIQKSCSNENKQNILSCLQRNINADIMPNTCRRVLYHRLMIFNNDIRLNEGFIMNCQTDINKYCPYEITASNDDEQDSDEDAKDHQNDDNNVITNREIDGRIIQCLRSKYVNTSLTLNYQCVTELIDVIRASKLNLKFDIQLYQNCRNYLANQCMNTYEEDCLKLLYQSGQIFDEGCKEQVKRIIKEEQVYLYGDYTLAFACQQDMLKFCKDTPIGTIKQLQCLLNVRRIVTTQCQTILLKRGHLWNSIQIQSDIIDNSNNFPTEFISYSTRFTYIAYCIIFLISIVMFIVGYNYRAHNQLSLSVEDNPLIQAKC